jgi:hypothetical protein
MLPSQIRRQTMNSIPPKIAGWQQPSSIHPETPDEKLPVSKSETK